MTKGFGLAIIKRDGTWSRTDPTDKRPITGEEKAAYQNDSFIWIERRIHKDIFDEIDAFIDEKMKAYQ